MNLPHGTKNSKAAKVMGYDEEYTKDQAIGDGVKLQQEHTKVLS